MRINTVVSLFHQAGAAAARGECGEAEAFVSTATSTPLWYNEERTDLTALIMKKLMIATMVGQNALVRCSSHTPAP